MTLVIGHVPVSLGAGSMGEKGPTGIRLLKIILSTVIHELVYK